MDGRVFFINGAVRKGRIGSVRGRFRLLRSDGGQGRSTARIEGWPTKSSILTGRAVCGEGDDSRERGAAQRPFLFDSSPVPDRSNYQG